MPHPPSPSVGPPAPAEGSATGTLRVPRPSRTSWRERVSALGLSVVVGGSCGLASALFLASLERVTAWREAHTHWVFALPIAGLVLGALVVRGGSRVQGGNDRVIDTIHDAGPVLPWEMGPLVLLGTLVTHLFGGSAGREGTAVQMGAVVADNLSHRLRTSPRVRQDLLLAGVSGGFGSVFGTPLAGAVFALEFTTPGRFRLRALGPSLVASFVGDATTRGMGIAHTPFPPVRALELSGSVVLAWVLVAVAVACVVVAFVAMTHALKHLFSRWVSSLPLRMACGGVVLVVLWCALGTDEPLGLGVPLLLRAFEEAPLPWHVALTKLLFTSITLGTGFLGGEVTPLFVVGASLGSALAPWVALPGPIAAGVCMAATFGAAANTPLALVVMAIELFGPAIAPHAALVTVLSYLLTGARGIYRAQRFDRPKWGGRPSSPLRPASPQPRGAEPGAKGESRP